MKTTQECISEFIEIHGTRYDYSLTEYINKRTKVKIICPDHGIFEKFPYSHNVSKQGCPECSRQLKIKDVSKVIDDFNIIHNNKYDYSLMVYINNKTKIKIICPDHGIFEQKPDCHIQGQGCPICNTLLKTQTQYIIDAINTHGTKYDYSLVEYINNKTKIKILCNAHGIFSQEPMAHLKGQGCPICNTSKGERIIQNYLSLHNIEYVAQKSFKDCRGKRKPLRFDFFIPHLNMCIEYDGEQHFNPVNYAGYKTHEELIHKFQITQINDKIKNEYCTLNNIRLIRIPFFELKNIHTILDKELL